MAAIHDNVCVDESLPKLGFHTVIGVILTVRRWWWNRAHVICSIAYRHNFGPDCKIYSRPVRYRAIDLYICHEKSFWRSTQKNHATKRRRKAALFLLRFWSVLVVEAGKVRVDESLAILQSVNRFNVSVFHSEVL